MAVKVQRPAVLESLPGENVWVFASGFFLGVGVIWWFQKIYSFN